MKRLMYSAFIAFWSSVGTVVVLAALSAPSGQAPEQRIVTAQELARHNDAKDCWMAIDGKVYDFTAYLPRHPAPPAVMTVWCGKEATQPFDTKGYGRPHSAAARAMLAEYLVGKFQPAGR